MQFHSTFLCCVVFLVPCSSSLESNYSGEIPVEQSITTEDESSQELSSQLLEVDSRSGGWSAWTQWSSCSRTCDGGVSRQFRTCHHDTCRGERMRYKICNMQPCPEERNFREDQCASFNKIPHDGLMYKWFAHHDEENPCALICKGKPMDYDPSSRSDDPVLIIAELGSKVHDGTRCRPGSLDMCIDGECETVGCDLRIRSTKQVDACGVCGGDGTSCARPLYHWTLTPMSLCSVTCGGGYRMSRSVCLNRVTGEEEEERLCNESQKPDSTIVPCSTHHCPPKWHTNEWGQCSSSCGGGLKIRHIHCVEEANNTKIRVDESKCLGHKPHNQEVCNQQECPKWHTSSWSGCSVSCGEGVQVRLVECRDADEERSQHCSQETRPTAKKSCSTGIQCLYHLKTSSEEIIPSVYHSMPLVQPYPPQAEKLVGEQVVPSESTFMPDEWGPCSVSCGEGVRKREVHCKIFLEFSRTIAKLPDKQCDGPKPVEIEKCMLEPCVSERMGIVVENVKDDPYRSDIKVAGASPGKSYSWKEQGYTHCSATCLGGVQELIVNCVRDDTQKVTSPFLCPIEMKPEILMRTCNDHPCPPRWNYSDFSPCSQSCGIGIQTREVNCIHEVTQGGGNTVIVPNNMCPQPPPPDRQYCNVLDCPVRWHLSDWSRCSKQCGGGEKTRKVECKQVMAQNHTVDRPLGMCPSPKPTDRKPCNTKSCVVDTDQPEIELNNSTYIQHDPKKKKVALRVGGAATVFLGTTVKIKCPVKRYNRTRISWQKDRHNLPRTKKYKTSKKGALRILNLTLRDSGLYTCTAGKSYANIHITVRAKPGEFPTSEEIQRQGLKLEKLPHNSYLNRDEGVPIFNSDDHSHEQRPELSWKKPSSSRPKLFTPTLPSMTLDRHSNNLNPWPAQSTSANMDQEKQDYSQLPDGSSDSLVPHFEEQDIGSSASRVLPHFQKLLYSLQHLWPFQTFSNSRGHRMITFPSEENISYAAPAASIYKQSDQDDMNTGEEIILGKGLPEQLKFEWVLTEWSKCSATCGSNGFQMRRAKCVVKLHNTTQGVDNNLCEDAGVEAPDTIQKCGSDVCPLWYVSDWTECEKSKCFAWNTAMQKRVVKCQLRGTSLNNSKCSQDDKPSSKQECHNEKCVGKWKVGPWSECAAGCEMHGVKYRILQCVWFGTKKPAGTACKGLDRPSVMKSCIGPPCTNAVSDCKDHSMFCPNVKAMNMCKILRYQQQCCETCNK